MLKRFTLLAAAAGLISGSAVAAEKLESQKEQIGYVIGMGVAQQLHLMKDEIELDALLLGMKDAFEGKESKLTQEQINTVSAEFNRLKQEKEQGVRVELATKNKQAGEAFLAKNAKQEGVVSLPSGLQYKVIKSGKGASPKATDTVVAHYHGTLIDGTVFDSSIQRGEPITFPVTGVIKGWQEALQKMHVGDKWQLVIPADLAYGENGAGQAIQPNSVLIFDVELLEIKKG